MGNKIAVPVEVPPHITEGNPLFPKVGDFVEVEPCFQCTDISGTKVAGPATTARITSVKHVVYVPEDEQDITGRKFKDSDYKCIVRGELLGATSITPYCGHAHGVLNAPAGSTMILRHKDAFGTAGTDAKGWLFKNQPMSTFLN